VVYVIEEKNLALVNHRKPGLPRIKKVAAKAKKK
jgi:hypothetical protein